MKRRGFMASLIGFVCWPFSKRGKIIDPDKPFSVINFRWSHVPVDPMPLNDRNWHMVIASWQGASDRRAWIDVVEVNPDTFLPIPDSKQRRLFE